MKTQIIRIASAALIVAAALSNPVAAKDKDPKKKATLAWSSIKPYGYSKKMQVSFLANDADAAIVRIKNANDETVYQETVKNPGAFRKIYNLDNLEHGVYTMEVATGDTKSERKFVIDEMMYDTRLRAIFLAKSDYQHYRIGIENPAQNDVNVQVKNAAGEVVYQETLKSIYKKVYEKDFSFLKSGEYTVEVGNDNGQFSKQLMIP